MEEKRRGVPTTAAQQGIWLQCRMHPGNPFYNSASVTAVRGDFDVDALSEAIRHVVDRHEALRVTFHLSGGRLLQRMSEHAGVSLDVADCSEPATTAVARADMLTTEVVLAPFDLAAGPLCRVLCLRIAPAEWRFVAVFHHVVADGISIGVFLREVADAYSALVAGRGLTADPPPLQFPDYAAWAEGEHHDGAVDLEYWARALDGAPHDTRLTGDRPAPRIPSFAAHAASIDVPAGTVDRLTDIARREGLSMYMALAPAVMLATATWSHPPRDQALMCVPAANRTIPAAETAMGCFVNTLVARLWWSHAEPSSLVRARMRSSTLDALAHQRLAFDRLVRAVRPERQPGYRNPISSTLFQVFERPGLQLAGTDCDEVRLPALTARTRFDMEVHLARKRDGISGVVLFSRDLVGHELAHIRTRRLECLIRLWGEHPDCSMGEMLSLWQAHRCT